MPPKFRRGQNEDQDRVQLLGLDSSDEEEEEIFLNSSPHVPHHSGRAVRPGVRGHDDPKIRQVQTQVSGVINVMRDNINKVLDRGDKLEDLEEKSEGLAESASHFRVSARRLERKMWWKNCREATEIKPLPEYQILAVSCTKFKTDSGRHCSYNNCYYINYNHRQDKKINN